VIGGGGASFTILNIRTVQRPSRCREPVAGATSLPRQIGSVIKSVQLRAHAFCGSAGHLPSFIESLGVRGDLSVYRRAPGLPGTDDGFPAQESSGLTDGKRLPSAAKCFDALCTVRHMASS
jgi:hypothetical protein